MGLYFTRNDFDILHKVGRINWDANGQSPDPCFNYKDIKRVHQFGDANLDTIPRWHALTYLFISIWGDNAP